MQRLRVLDCLGGNCPFLPDYFEPPANADIFKAFDDYIAKVSQVWAAETDPLSVSLVAAGRLLTGDLAAEVILDNLPAKAFKLNHRAGICMVVPLYSLSTALPLPTHLQNTTRWVAGSAEQTALRAWLAEHRDMLRWVAAGGVYVRVPARDDR